MTHSDDADDDADDKAVARAVGERLMTDLPTAEKIRELEEIRPGVLDMLIRVSAAELEMRIRFEERRMRLELISRIAAILLGIIPLVLGVWLASRDQSSVVSLVLILPAVMAYQVVIRDWVRNR